MTEEAEPILPPERLLEAKRLSAIRYRALLLRMMVSALYLTLLLAGGGQLLWRAMPSNVLFVAALLLGHSLIGLPLSYYMFLQFKRYGLVVQSSGGWLADQLKATLLSWVLLGSMALLILWLWQAKPDSWYWWIAGSAVILNIFIFYVSPVLIAPLFDRYRPLSPGELYDRLRQLSQRAAVSVRGVYVVESSSKQRTLNASLSGLGSTRRIVLFDTLVAQCTVDEVEVILAHEMGHHRFHHITKMMLLWSGFILLLFLVAGYAVQPLSHLLNLGGLGPPALPLITLFFAVGSLLFLPGIMAISRQWERACDHFALDQTRNPAAFISAFRKLAISNLADTDPPRWVYYFFGSHPTIPDRVAMAVQWSSP